MGYSKIPAKFRKPLEACEDKLFMGTSYSPKKVYETGLKQALAVLKANGAKFDGEKIIVPQKPITEMPLEENAPSADKVSRKIVSVKFADSTTFEFEGVGVTLTTSPEFNKAFKDFAEAQKEKGAAGEIEISLDGKKIRTAKFFADKHLNERDFLFSARGLPNGKHKLEFKLANAKKGFPEFFGYLRIYSEKK